MHLCDNPQQVGNDVVRPVPIILTGNNFTTIYKPLRRHGRMRLFKWIPGEEERPKIVAQILSDLSPQPKTVSKLLTEYPDKSIDFFHQVKTELLHELLPGLIPILQRVSDNRETLYQEGLELIKDHFNSVENSELESKLLKAAKRIDVCIEDYLTDGYHK